VEDGVALQHYNFGGNDILDPSHPLNSGPSTLSPDQDDNYTDDWDFVVPPGSTYIVTITDTGPSDLGSGLYYANGTGISSPNNTWTLSGGQYYFQVRDFYPAPYSITITAATSSAQPDLVVQNLSASPSSIAVGGTITVSFDTLNNGTDTATASQSALFLETSSNSVIESWTFSDGQLTPQASDHHNQTFTIPTNLTAGTYKLVAEADANNQFYELDNISSKTIQITVPVSNDDSVDLTAPSSFSAVTGVNTAISGVQVIDDGLNGETFTVQVQAGNSSSLSATGTGVTGSGSHNLTITGTLGQVNAALGTLSYFTTNPAGSGESVSVTVTDSDSSTKSKNFAVSITGAPAVTLTPTQDIWITNTFDNGSNYGVDNAQLKVGGWGDKYDSLIKFDLSSVRGSHVTSAVLKLYNLADLGGTPVAMEVDELQTSWNDSYGWYSYGTSPHSGGAITQTPQNLQFKMLETVPAPSSTAGWINIDITSAVNDWLANPSSNFGILLQPLATNNNFNDFVSSEAIGAQASLVPELTLSANTSVAAGFDTSTYPGDLTMGWLRKNTNLSWVGYYLAPAPSRINDTWMGHRATLASEGWTIAPIYVAEQAIAGNWSSNPSASKGIVDGDAAAALMSSQGFAAGSVVYLDVETGSPLSANEQAYIANWCSQIALDGFTAGVYCPGSDADTIAVISPSAHIWVADLNILTAPGGTVTFPIDAPSGSGHLKADAWQYQ
jgi:hypothetical protein